MNKAIFILLFLKSLLISDLNAQNKQDSIANENQFDKFYYDVFVHVNKSIGSVDFYSLSTEYLWTGTSGPEKYKEKSLLQILPVASSLMLLSLIFILPYFSYMIFIIYGFIKGIITAISFAVINTVMFSSLEKNDKASGNAAYLFLSQLGSCLGITLLMLLFEIGGSASHGNSLIFHYVISGIALISIFSCLFFRQTKNYL